MPSPFTLLGTQQTVDKIDIIINENKPKKLHVYVDLKNVLVSLFVESVCQEIMANSRTMVNMDTSIFQAILLYTSYWKSFGLQRELETKVFIATDVGRSMLYHLPIDKGYKGSREISNVMSAVSDQYMKTIRDKNFDISELVLNKIPNVYFFCLRFLESDFIPYYLITRKFPEDDTFNIICSGDKDMYQAVFKPNTIMTYKLRQNRYIVDCNSIIPAYCRVDKKVLDEKFNKKNKMLNDFNPKYITALMAIIGDTSDDVKGVKGIGAVKGIEMFNELDTVNKIIGTPEELQERIDSNGKFFLEDRMGISQMSKLWQKAFVENQQVTNAYKLISFESLCKWLDENQLDMNCIKMRKYIKEVLDKKDIQLIPNAKSLCISLSGFEDLQIREEHLLPLFV